MIVSRLKQVMEEKGFTLRQLAREAKLAEETVLKARRGGGKGEMGSCTLITLESMATALGVKIKDLFEEV